MIVEDSISMRHVLQNVVQHAGFCAVTARDGVDAIETLTNLEEAPDVFLLDVEMPRMDGYDLLTTLRQEEAFAQTPIIMITSRSGDKHREQAFSLGATDYLTKPVEDDTLVRTIQQHLSVVQ